MSETQQDKRGPEQPTGEFAAQYSDEGFWKKLKEYALVAGREVLERALALYFAFQAPDTPMWAKSIILGALGYFISPVDAIPDPVPVAGYSDDLGVLVAALAAVAVHITPSVKEKAKAKVRDWFGDEVPAAAHR